MPDRIDKQFERRLARDMHTERLPSTGERDGADFETPVFVAQAKKGRRFPSYLRDWLTGIVQTGLRKGKIGFVVWAPRRGTDVEAVVILRWEDWIALHGSTHARE